MFFFRMLLAAHESRAKWEVNTREHAEWMEKVVTPASANLVGVGERSESKFEMQFNSRDFHKMS